VRVRVLKGLAFFTQAEAAALVTSAEEGGELYDAMDAAYASWRKAHTPTPTPNPLTPPLTPDR